MRISTFIFLTIVGSFITLSCEKNVEEDYIDASNDCSQAENYFTQSVLPIMEQNCTSCHSGSSPYGNLELTSFASVKNNMGEILDRVNRTQGTAGFMPLGGSKLSEPDLDSLQTFYELECDE